MSLLTDSSPVGKQNFLSCYQKARKEALTAKNIKNGWKATGLWPKSIAKPLMSRLLLENSNRVQGTPQALQNFNNESKTDSPPIPWFTPKRSTEIKAQAARFQKLQEQRHSTYRLLFQKVIKDFEE